MAGIAAGGHRRPRDLAETARRWELDTCKLPTFCQPQEQHDVVEFLQFLLPRLAWIGDRLSWGARLRVAGADEEVIHRVNVHVLMLNPPDSLCNSSIQIATNSWHKQRICYCACSYCFSILRFPMLPLVDSVCP